MSVCKKRFCTQFSNWFSRITLHYCYWKLCYTRGITHRLLVASLILINIAFELWIFTYFWRIYMNYIETSNEVRDFLWSLADKIGSSIFIYCQFLILGHKCLELQRSLNVSSWHWFWNIKKECSIKVCLLYCSEGMGNINNEFLQIANVVQTA